MVIVYAKGVRARVGFLLGSDERGVGDGGRVGRLVVVALRDPERGWSSERSWYSLARLVGVPIQPFLDEVPNLVRSMGFH
jgi:hypothetical protein